MKTERFNTNDIKHLGDLQPEGWDDIVPMFNFYVNSTFCFPIKVKIDSEIVGVGTSIIHNDVAWLAHIIVHPSCRKRGIGQHLTQSLINSSQSANCTTIHLLATEFGAPVYKKVGFVTITDYLFFKDINYSMETELSKFVLPYTNDLRSQIAQIDQQVSGEDRMFHLEQMLSNSYVYLRKGVVEGYFIPSFGEGLIIANSEVAGLELMKLRLTSNERASFPSDNIAAQEFLSQHNYLPFKKEKRMSWGEKRTVLFDKIYNRIGGNMG